jgi:uncharacterized protein YlxW (UPF0749 family)
MDKQTEEELRAEIARLQAEVKRLREGPHGLFNEIEEISNDLRKLAERRGMAPEQYGRLVLREIMEKQS